MKRRLSLCFGLLLLAAALLAQSVDRDEFSDILNRSINFINYSGAYDRVDTLGQIDGIGRGLAAGLTRDKPGTSTLGDKYTVIHALGTPQEKGKPADILMLLPNSGVDHINNVRRIIASYLSGMYGYKKADADVLAVFITIYNAVYRGNLTLISSRYKPSVIKYLSAEKLGLSLNYVDWPGKSQIIIPLSLAALDKNGNSLASVSSSALVTPEVIETVRDKPGTGTKERQDLSNLMDRAVDQEQNAIDQKKAKLDTELAANKQRQQEIDAKIAADKAATDKAAVDKANAKNASAESNNAAANNAAANNAAANSSAANDKTANADTTKTNNNASDSAANTTKANTASDTKALQDEKTKLQADEKRIANENKNLADRNAENKDTAKASQDLRTATAADLKDQGKETAVAATPTVVLKSRLENNLILSQAQRVLLSSQDVLQQSSVKSLIGRHLQNFGDGLLGLAQDGANANLVLLSPKDLEPVKKGAAVISVYSEIVILVGGTEILAITKADGDWYLGKFDLQLNLIAKSPIAIDPVSAITVSGDKVLIQKKDGRFTYIQEKDLRVGQ